jgi:hypothetical protein
MFKIFADYTAITGTHTNGTKLRNLAGHPGPRAGIQMALDCGSEAAMTKALGLT